MILDFSGLKEVLVKLKGYIDSKYKSLGEGYNEAIATATKDLATRQEVQEAADAAVAKVVADADESFDTLKEIADWIASDETKSADLATSIGNNSSAIKKLQDGKQDKGDYAINGSSYTKAESDSKYLTEHQDLTDYAKKSDIPTKTSELANDSGYLTEHQDISALATKEEVAGKADKSDIVEQVQSDWNETDTASKAYINNKPEIPTKVSELQNDAGYITLLSTGEISAQVQSDWEETDSTSKAYILHKPEIPTVPTRVSAFENDKNYLTEHQDLSGYATIEYVDTSLAGKADSSTVYTKEEIDAKNYLTEHQSLDGYAKKEDVASLSPVLVTTKSSFPETGSSNTLYIATDGTNRGAYIWDDEAKAYTVLGITYSV